MTIRRQVLPFLGALALLGLSAASAPAADLHPWRTGTTSAKSDAGFVMMAAKRGFAEKQGLALDMMQFNGDAVMLKALLAGDLDSYEASPGNPLIAATRGADVKILGCYWPGLTYGVFARKGIDTVAEMKGKSLAVSAPGALPDLVSRVLLAQNGMSGDDIHLVLLGSDTDRFKAVAAGIVDTTAISSEWTPLAKAQGVNLLANAHDFAPKFLRLCTITTGKVIAARHDDAVAYITAQMNAERYALSHRDETLALTREITSPKPDDPRPAYIYDETLRDQAIDPTLPIPLDKLAWMQDLLVQTGNIKTPIDVAKITDGSIRTAALQRADH